MGCWAIYYYMLDIEWAVIHHISLCHLTLRVVASVVIDQQLFNSLAIYGEGNTSLFLL